MELKGICWLILEEFLIHTNEAEMSTAKEQKLSLSLAQLSPTLSILFVISEKFRVLVWCCLFNFIIGSF